MSFSDFKKRSQNSLGDLTSKLEAMNKKDSYKDDRFWRPELDSSSNGYAVVRFLDTAKDEDMPFVKYYSHGFQGPGGWYIENSRTTFGEKDPVSNIMVISDPANPSNEGKVFLYRYGQKIHNKIIEVMQPEFQDEEPVNPFDMWKGADFKLKIRKVSGFINYDKSEFASPSPLLEGNDDALERIWNQQYPLNEFIDPSNYKSYDDLKSRLNEVLGNDIRLTMNENKTKDNIETAEIKEDVPNTESSDSVDASDALSYFEKLASED